MTIVDRALEFVKTAHAGQTDIFGDGQIGHVTAVADLFEAEDVKAAALLHDVLKMTDTSYDQLTELFGAAIADIVSALTPRAEEPMHAYIARIRENPAAREIKVAEIHRDMDLSRKQTITEQDKRERDMRFRLLYQLSV